MKIRYGKRTAISPIIATVLIIAVTLIAAVAIAGFVFGIFSSGASTAQVAVTSITCSHLGTCTITLTNTGNAVTTIGGSGTVTYAGTTSILGTAQTTSPGNQVNAGGQSQTAVFTFTPAGTAGPGQQYTGYVSLGNGAQIQFAGVFT